MSELKIWNWGPLEIERTYGFALQVGIHFWPEFRPWMTLGPFEFRLICTKDRSDGEYSAT